MCNLINTHTGGKKYHTSTVNTEIELSLGKTRLVAMIFLFFSSYEPVSSTRTKLCQKRPQVPGLGHPQSYARFKGGKTKQGYQRMVGWCRLMVMVMADGDG